LKQVEENDDTLHKELNFARKVLLKIMREVFAAYDHISNLGDDLKEVEEQVITFITLLCFQYPLLSLHNFFDNENSLVNKLIKSSMDELYLVRLAAS
jgi:hypothetical protein